MSSSLFEAADLALANKAVTKPRPKPVQPPLAARPPLAPGAGVSMISGVGSAIRPIIRPTIQPDRIVTIKVESAKMVESAFVSRFKADVDAKEVLEHSEGASCAVGPTKTLAEVHALTEALDQVRELFPTGLTQIHAALPTGLGGFAKANLPTYARMGILDEDQSRAEATFNGQMKNPVPLESRASYRRLAEALEKQPILVNW